MIGLLMIHSWKTRQACSCCRRVDSRKPFISESANSSPYLLLKMRCKNAARSMEQMETMVLGESCHPQTGWGDGGEVVSPLLRTLVELGVLMKSEDPG